MGGTYHPSWLADPAEMPNIEASYRYAVPGQWPRGLRFEGTEIHTHRQAIGIALSWVGAAMWVLLRKYFPHRDDLGVFLGEWETAFGLQPGGTIAQRQARIIASARNRGQGCESVVFSIMSAAYGEPGNGSFLEFSVPDMSTIIADAPPAGDPGWLDAFCGHFYPTGGQTLDEAFGDYLLIRSTPAGWHWTAGDQLLLEATNIAIDRGVVE